MEDTIVNLVNEFGPIAVLLLLILPLGEDLIIIPAGFMIGQDPEHFPWLKTFLCAYIGAFISDAIWYFMCYRFGTPLLHKNWFKRLAHPRRLLQAKHQMERKGAWLIVTARFVPGSRTTAMIVAGLLHLPLWKFLAAECGCLLITVPLQLGFGVLISHGVGSTSTAGKIMTILAVITGLTIGAFIVNWLVRHYRNSSGSTGTAPRSKAAWLRRFRVPRIKSAAAAAKPTATADSPRP